MSGLSPEDEYDCSLLLSRLQDSLSSPSFLSSADGPQSQREPCELLPQLYLGDYSDATSLGLLSELGVTHVLNCAGASRDTAISPYTGPTSVRFYKQVDAEDQASYRISDHFDEVIHFIDSAVERGGTVLVHCVRGMNRSVAVCLAYMMTCSNMSLWSAVERVHSLRGTVLTNTGFQQQLLHYAHKIHRL